MAVSSGRLSRPSKPIRLKCSYDILLLSLAFLIFNLAWFNFKLSLSPTTTSTIGFSSSNSQRIALDHPLPVRQKRQQLPDGTFNGYPVYFYERKHDTPASIYTTTPHCVGETYQGMLKIRKKKKFVEKDPTWMSRSCHYSFMCFDIDKQDFVVVQPPNEERILPALKENPDMDVSQGYLRLGVNSSSLDSFVSVSIGGINQKWTWNDDGIGRLQWAPRVLDEPPTSFYTLPSNVAMIPFHSLNGANPGHLVWDDFIPAYTLMSMFGLQDHEPLMLRYVLPDGRGLWASCDLRDANRQSCYHLHKKFWPLMNKNERSKVTTNIKVEWQTPMNKSNYICARHGLVGMGSLTDHGSKCSAIILEKIFVYYESIANTRFWTRVAVKAHGWEKRDYESVHNHGKAGLLWSFRMFAISNVGIVEKPLKPPFRIVYSVDSSKIPARNVDFSRQIDALESALDPSEATIEKYRFADYSLKEQMQIASDAAIFVTACGGGTVTGTFVQRGASLFIYYRHDGGVSNNKHTGKPARLDWDIFNNMGYARVHWLPKATINRQEDLDVFVQLVKNALNSIKRGESEKLEKWYDLHIVIHTQSSLLLRRNSSNPVRL